MSNFFYKLFLQSKITICLTLFVCGTGLTGALPAEKPEVPENVVAALDVQEPEVELQPSHNLESEDPAGKLFFIQAYTTVFITTATSTLSTFRYTLFDRLKDDLELVTP